MRIGIDISQIVYEGTGVGTYVRRMVEALLSSDKENTYVLFGSSMRRKVELLTFVHHLEKTYSNVEPHIFSFPPLFLDILWNRLHIMPITWFTGSLDVFWSSDWTQPPLGKVKGVTTIHDVSFFRFSESFNRMSVNVKKGTVLPDIVASQKRRLSWALKECYALFCDSIATKKDVQEFLHCDEKKLVVVYPGFSPIL